MNLTLNEIIPTFSLLCLHPHPKKERGHIKLEPSKMATAYNCIRRLRQEEDKSEVSLHHRVSPSKRIFKKQVILKLVILLIFPGFTLYSSLLRFSKNINQN